MVVLEALLLLMGLVLFFSNPKNENIRWASLIGFFGGSGGLSVLLETNLHSPEWNLLLHGLFSSLGHYWTPYAIFIFGLLYSDTIKTAKQKLLCKILFLFPIIIMYSLYQIYPEFIVDYAVLSAWVVPYVIVSDILLISSAWQETRPVVKRQRILTCLIIVPTTSFTMLTNTILEAVGVAGLWMYNSWIIGLQFLLFLYFLVKYGFLGIQLKFEKQRHHSTMKTAATGTALLNHSIKNELAKIDLLVNQLKDKVSPNENSYENIDLVLNSTHHVLDLSTRIQNRLNIMEIKETEFWLGQIIDVTINLLQPYLSEVNVKISYEFDVKIYGDVVHIQESFLNIIKNSIEAMDGRGEILIKIYKTRKYCCIEFIDNGKGIGKSELFRVLDPFYSTKGKAGNYGLGLTYCYNVMEKHGGNILIKSKINQGTTITLSLPTKRIIDTKTNRQSNSKHKEITTYGKNQSHDLGR